MLVMNLSMAVLDKRVGTALPKHLVRSGRSLSRLLHSQDDHLLCQYCCRPDGGMEAGAKQKRRWRHRRAKPGDDRAAGSGGVPDGTPRTPSVGEVSAAAGAAYVHPQGGWAASAAQTLCRRPRPEQVAWHDPTSRRRACCLRRPSLSRMREIRTYGLIGSFRKRSRRATAPEVYQ